MTIKLATTNIAIANTMAREHADPSIKEAFQAHLQRQNGIQLCKALIRLTIEVQKHRGCTLAILSGDHFFETQLFGIQRDITANLQQIEELRLDYLNEDEIKPTIQEWVCLRRQWRKDSVQQNFLLHSNLIAELLKLVWLVARRSQQMSLNEAHNQLMSFCLRDWLKLMETAAQARGLATHVAASQATKDDIQSRIRFLNTQLERLSEEFKLSIAKLHPEQGDLLERAIAYADFDNLLNLFQTELENHFCSTAPPNIDADQIYTSGSHVVRACQQVLWSALKLIEKTLSPKLQAWVEGANQSANCEINLKQ
jgi:hypothetical protein